LLGDELSDPLRVEVRHGPNDVRLPVTEHIRDHLAGLAPRVGVMISEPGVVIVPERQREFPALIPIMFDEDVRGGLGAIWFAADRGELPDVIGQ